jgi:V/A-type H+-transporting ATPase subunit K
VGEPTNKLKMQITLSIIVISAVMAIIGSVFCTSAFAAPQGETEVKSAEAVNAEVSKFGLVSASIAFGLGAIGAGIAISHVGAAAMGAVAEKPQIAGQALIFVALAEGIVVFGFITALMILGKV